MKRVLALSALALPSFALADNAPPTAALKGEMLAQIEDAEKKLIALAQTTPAEKLTWRPAEGIRSISEVYMHVAGGNYFILSFAGVRPPEGIDRGMEKSVTEKSKVIETLQKSFAHVRTGLQNASDAEMDRKIKLFGRDATIRSVYLLLISHAHEHLGQSIAYARINKIAPPWSEAAAPAPPPAK